MLQTIVCGLVDGEIANGTPASSIVLGGFSQGGALALHVNTKV
jgi:predicted esterase